MAEARVSIGIPTRNNPDGLRSTLRDITGQTYGNLEIIVSDNDSDKDMASVVGEFRDPRIRYVRQPHNIGLAANFEYVLKEAQGEYFMWAADDDAWASNYIEAMVENLQMYPSAILAFSNYAKDSGGVVQLTKCTRLLEFREIIRKVFSLDKINVAMYGVFRCGAVRTILANGLVKWADGSDRVMLAQIAVAGNHVVLDGRCLHTRKAGVRTPHYGFWRGLQVRLRLYLGYVRLSVREDRGYYALCLARYVWLVESIYVRRYINQGVRKGRRCIRW